VTEQSGRAVAEEWTEEPTTHESKTEARTVAESFEAEAMSWSATTTVAEPRLEGTSCRIRIE
jgi:hypothetical protein